MRVTGSGFTAACVLLTGASASAQLVAPPGKPADPGVSDIGPLSLGRVDTRVDLRAPTDFDRVYEVEVKDQGGARKVYYRANGAVTAVFPASVYVPSSKGSRAVIPPGTIFHFAPPEEVFAESKAVGRPAPAPETRADRRRHTRADFGDAAAGRADRRLDFSARLQAKQTTDDQDAAADGNLQSLAHQPPTIGSIWASDKVRGDRVASLLAQALEHRPQ